MSEAKDLLNKDFIRYEDIISIKNRLDNSIKEFENNIIKPVDKSKLKSVISQAKQLYNDSTEGSQTGQYKSGSKSTLMNAINKAEEVYNNSYAKQDEINTSASNLNSAIDNFKNSIIKEFSLSKAMQLLKDKYTSRIDEGKRKEFEGRFIYKPYMKQYGSGSINGTKYYEIMHGFDAYPIDGQPFYDDMYGEYIDKMSGGSIYRVYENGKIDMFATYD